MVLMVVFLFTLLLFGGLVLDYGRAHLLRSQLQTALDAGALSGALDSEPWIHIKVLRWRWHRVWEYCWDPVEEEEYICGWHWDETPAHVELEGREEDIWWYDRWRSMVSCAWPYTCGREPEVLRRWIVMLDDAAWEAEHTFRLNATWPDRVNLKAFAVGTSPDSTAVEVEATLGLPTTLLRLVGIHEITVQRRAAAVPVRRSIRPG